MGHTRVGVLPETRSWNDVRDLLASEIEGDVGAVVDRTIRATQALFGNADAHAYGTLAKEPGAVYAVWTLMTVPALARRTESAEAFALALRREGLGQAAESMGSPLAFLAALTDSVRSRARAEQIGTFTEVAITSLRETLAREIVTGTAPLFGGGPDEVRSQWARLGTRTGFARLAGGYFGALLRRTLAFYLTKELPQQVGANRRFADFTDAQSFEADLAVWSRERAAIVERLSADWVPKQLRENQEREGRERIEPEAAQRYLAYALSKVGSEVSVHTEPEN